MSKIETAQVPENGTLRVESPDGVVLVSHLGGIGMQVLVYDASETYPHASAHIRPRDQ